MSELQVGDRVRSHVAVLGERVPTHIGIITRIDGGCAWVDRMSLHGGAPWVVCESLYGLTLDEGSKP